MEELMRRVLESEAARVSGGIKAGKSAAQVIGETLVSAAMDGDLKAAAMVMELAGLDAKSRERREAREEKPEEVRVVFEDVRPAKRERFIPQKPMMGGEIER